MTVTIPLVAFIVLGVLALFGAVAFIRWCYALMNAALLAALDGVGVDAEPPRNGD